MVWEVGVWEVGVWEVGVWEVGVWEVGVWEVGVWCGGRGGGLTLFFEPIQMRSSLVCIGLKREDYVASGSRQRHARRDAHFDFDQTGSGEATGSRQRHARRDAHFDQLGLR